MMFCDCFFCKDFRFRLNIDMGLPGEDSVVYEDNNIYVTPDIAPLVCGHFLIITKEHLNSFGNANDGIYDSLIRAKVFIKCHLLNGMNVLFFEHGAVLEGSAGVCIDHAHMHAIPLYEDIDIDNLIKKFGFITSNRLVATRETLVKCADDNQPYLYYETSDGVQWYYPVGMLPSQFFRRIIAFYFSKNYAWRDQCKNAASKELFIKTLELAGKTNNEKYLYQLGEDKIIQDIIYKVFPHLQKSRDDAAILGDIGTSQLVFSTDPCPEPIATYFDNENRYYHYGRMSVLINYSDLAAMGAKPVGILLSTIMDNNMLENDYYQFQIGVKDACNDWGGNLLDGNIKDGTSFSVNGTSIGIIEEGSNLLKRKGSQENDAICVIGELGMFWLAVLKLKNNKISLNQLDDYTKSFLTQPRPKIKEGLILSRCSSVTACMDSSDGIIGCLYELAKMNDVSMQIDDNKLTPNSLIKDFCLNSEYDHRNLMLSWGGWELVFTCKSDKLGLLYKVFNEHGCDFKVIGEVVSKESNLVTLIKDSKKYYIQDFSSKRFNKNSYFSYGLDTYIEQLKNIQIFPIN